MKRQQLKAKVRKIFGRKVKTLRKQGILPANVFGKKISSKALSLDSQEFHKVFAEAGETSLIDLVIEEEEKARPVLVTNTHIDPVSDQILHVDLHQVDLKSKTTAEIPVEVVGEAPAVKELGGVLIVNRNEIEVEALPTDLPENITVDVSSLAEIGASITAADLKYDREKVTLLIEPEEVIVTVEEPAPEEVVEPTPEEEVAEPGAEAPAEGGEPAPEEAEKPQTEE